MPTITVRMRTGETRSINATSNHSIMETLRDNGIDEIEALCGGSCACATCHVYIDEKFKDQMPPMSSAENDLLDASDSRRANSRLSCQLILSEEFDGMEVEVAPAM
jgi:ferredoxin, 2Fe-2S